jgi:putative phage-type endonuclease
MSVDRTKFIGGSDAPVLFGLSKHRTPVELFFDKTAPRKEDKPDEGVLRRGKILEPVVRELVIAKLKDDGHQVELLAVNQRYVDSELPFLACEIDAELLLDGQPANVEIKTNRFKDREWGEEDSDDVPLAYACQAMHGLMVTGKPTCIFGALFGLDDLTLYRVPRDEETIAAIRAKEVQFWKEHVLKGVPPAPVNMDDIKRLFSKTNGKPVELDMDSLAALERLVDVRQQQKALGDEEQSLMFNIAKFVCQSWGAAEPVKGKDGTHTVDEGVDNAVLTFNGAPVATWKKQRGAHFDSQALKAANPELHASLMREHWFRVLRPKL